MGKQEVKELGDISKFSGIVKSEAEKQPARSAHPLPSALRLLVSA